MAQSKPGMRSVSPKRSAAPIPKAPRVPAAEAPPDLTARMHACEGEIERAHADIALLRGQLADLRLAVERSGTRVLAVGRKLPPPLPPDSASEIISVDASDVTIESIRPRAPKIR
jgi:hypothetical protein